MLPAVIAAVYMENLSRIKLLKVSASREAMRASGNADVTLRILPNHNHLFLKDTDGRFTDKRYWKLLHHTNRLSEGFLKIVADWVSTRLKP